MDTNDHISKLYPHLGLYIAEVHKGKGDSLYIIKLALSHPSLGEAIQQTLENTIKGILHRRLRDEYIAAIKDRYHL